MNKLVTVFVMLSWALGTYSQVSTEHQALLEEANESFENKHYVEAYPQFSQLVSLYPKDSDLNFKFGTCCIYSSTDNEKAIKHLRFSIKKGAALQAQYYLGVAYHLNYEFSKAIEAYEAFERKADEKLAETFDAPRQVEMCKAGKGLLAGMVDLVVLDKKETSEVDFFRYFNLEGIGGKLLTVPAELRTKLDSKKEHTGVIHFPVGSSVIYFSSYGKKGAAGKDIYRASVMPDGSFSQVEPLKGDINTSYDEDYPYMHPDGKTMYFASKGHNSMGGYDIFRSELDPATGAFGPAINMDFAINTPGDDILYVADSLNQSAYFASGRSSSQGNLHVYKVMVKGIPLHLIFLKGEFFSQFDQQAKSAKILIKDELTGKPVTELRTDDMSGEYLISFPKPGLYSFEVETDRSPIVHKGMVEIPVVDESTAFRQELHLVNVNGQEKLVIHNFFDEELNVDLASLSGEMLRNRAGLEVNVTDELLSQLEEPKAQIESAEKAALSAGFGVDDSIDSIVSDAESFASQLDVESTTLKSKSGKAFRRAEELQDEASSKARQAEAIMHGVNQDDQETYLIALREYVQVVNEARNLSDEARVAFETGIECVAIADSSAKVATEIRANNQSVQEATAFENFDLAVEGLRWERNRQISLAQDKDEVDSNLINRANAKEEDQKTILQKITNLRAEEDDLERKIKVNEQELANDPKKKNIAQLEANIEKANQGLNATRQEVIFETSKAEKIGRDEIRLRKEAVLLVDLTGSGVLLSDFDEGEFDSNQREKLRAGITGTKTKIDVLSIDDAETLALLGDEQRKTRNDISKLTALASAEVESGVQLKSLKNVRSDYQSRQIELVEIDPVSDNYRCQAIARMAVSEITQQEFLLKTLKSQITDAGEVAQVDEELILLNEFRDEIQVQLISLQQTAPIEIRDDAVKQAIARVMPEYDQSVQKANNAEGTELSRWQEVNRVREDLKARSEEEYQINEQNVLASNDPDEIAQLSLRNLELDQVIDQVDYQLNDVQLIKAAYELDNIAVIESDKDSSEKLRSQIELTHTYISTLDAESMKAKVELNGVPDKERLTRISDEADQASIKLAAYQSDLDLTMAAESSPDTNEGEDRNIDEIAEEVNLPADETETVNAEIAIEGADLKAIPQNMGTLIVQLDPNYQQDWNRSNLEISEPVERAQTKININSELINLANGEIEQRTTAMDLTQNEGEKDQWQLDIQMLERLVEQKSDEINNLNRVIDDNTEEWAGLPVGEEEFNSANGFDDNTLYTQSGSEYVKEMLSTTLRTDSRMAFRTENYSSLVLSHGTDDNEIKNQEKITQLETEIIILDEQVDATEKDSEKKKLDRKTEKLYQQLADEDIRNAPKLDAMTSLEYEDNIDLIEELKSSANETLAQNEYLSKRLDRLLEEVDYEFEEADETRDEAAPEIDKIKQSFMYRDAFTREMAAIRNQEKAIEILQNIEALSFYSEEDLVTIMRGETLKATSANDDTEVAIENEDVAISPETAEEIALTKEQNSFLDAALVEFTMSLDEKQVQQADVITRSAIEEMLLADYSLNTSQIGKVVNDGRWDDYLSQANGLTAKSKNYNDRIQQRNSMMTQLASLEADLDTWATVARKTKDPAESAGLLEEMRKTYAVAQVLYEDIQTLDAELEEDESEFTQLTADLNAAYNKVEIEEEINAIAQEMTADSALADAETETEAEAEAEAEADTDTDTEADTETDAEAEVETVADTNSFEIETVEETDELISSLEVVEETSSLTPELAIASAGSSPAMPRTAADFISFNYPEILANEIYARMDEAVYSDENPIPVDIAMPEGVVYKVQVGAFRKAIPQSHFAEFAPVMGETVGTGITRYTAGLFTGFTSADLAKAEIRGLGYRDAFVVAFRNGVRIPLYEAREDTGEELVVAAEGPSSVTELAPEGVNTRTSENVDASFNNDSSVDVAVYNTSTNASNNVDKTSPTVSEEVLSEYYDNNPTVAKATRVESLEGLFFTVQVGVYSKPVSSRELFNVTPLNSELTQIGKVRYTTGIYNNIIAASVRKDEIRQLGIVDAFVTAYYNGTRVSITQASNVVRSGGANVLEVSDADDSNELAKQPSEEYDVFLGTFQNEVPSIVAQAMLFLEDKYGILQRKNGDATSYFTARVSSLQQAKNIQAAFDDYGVETQVRTYEDGVETETE